MKKTLKAYLVLLTLISAAACQPIRTVKVTVIGDDQQPIKDAKVLVGFVGDDKGIEGLTDENGVFEASSEEPLLRMLTRVNKEGYYETEQDRLSKKKDHDLTLVLRKKINPIPLYAKRWRIVTEVMNQKLGFDFEAGDWVEPNGRGTQADVLFKVNYQKENIWTYTYKIEISFPNKMDGIQSFETIKYSILRSPHQAPEEGYQKGWVHTASREGKGTKIKKDGSFDRNYWLRVRSKVNENGKLVSANYVKIYGNFPDLHYYFKPKPNDRNLEFDPSQNLLKGLNSIERTDLP